MFLFLSSSEGVLHVQLQPQDSNFGLKFLTPDPATVETEHKKSGTKKTEAQIFFRRSVEEKGDEEVWVIKCMRRRWRKEIMITKKSAVGIFPNERVA